MPRNGFHVSQSFTNLTDANGNYSFPNLLGGAYVIAPKPVTGVSYAPVSSAKSVPPTVANVNFAGTLILSTYNVFGQITLGTSGPAYANVTVLAKGTNNANLPVSFSTNSDSGGTYFLTGLPAGTYVITPQPAGFFVPASFAVTLPPGTNMNFVGLTATNSSLLISQTGGSSLVKLSFATWVPNLTYRIQASTNLINWQDIDTVTPATNTIIIPVATNGFPTRYFRAVSP